MKKLSLLLENLFPYAGNLRSKINVCRAFGLLIELKCVNCILGSAVNTEAGCWVINAVYTHRQRICSLQRWDRRRAEEISADSRRCRSTSDASHSAAAFCSESDCWSARCRSSEPTDSLHLILKCREAPKAASTLRLCSTFSLSFFFVSLRTKVSSFAINLNCTFKPRLSLEIYLNRNCFKL